LGRENISHLTAWWKNMLVTDHQPLTFLMTKPDLVSLLAKRAITLQQYSFKVVHKPGADCLSRLPAESTEDVTGARLHDEAPQPMRGMMSPKICAILAAGENQDLGMLYDMHHLAPFSDTFAPSGTDMVTHCLDQPPDCG